MYRCTYACVCIYYIYIIYIYTYIHTYIHMLGSWGLLLAPSLVRLHREFAASLARREGSDNAR